MKVEFGDNRAIEKSMRSGISSQVDQRFKGLGAKSNAAYSQGPQKPAKSALKGDESKRSKSHRSRKTAAMMNKKETIVDEEEESYYDDQEEEEYESEQNEESD